MIELKKPGAAFKRFFAILCDSIILYAINLVLKVLSMLAVDEKVFAKIDKSFFTEYGKFDNGYIASLFTIFSILFFVYFEQSKWQATPGKKLFGLIVEDVNGSRLSFFRAFARTILYNLPVIPAIALFVLGALNVLKGIDPKLIVIAWSCITITWYLVWFLPILFTKNKTGLYEILSKTRVVQK